MCKKNNPLIKTSRFNNVYITNKPIAVEKVILIDDVYKTILNEEEKKEIIIKRYNELTDQEITKIRTTAYLAIIKERLVIDPWEKSEFVKKNFKESWDSAVDAYKTKTHCEILNEIYNINKF